MTEWRNPLDGTPGTTVTAANGGGDAWSTTVGGAMVYVASPTWSGPAAAVGSSDTAGYLLRQVQNTGRIRAVGYVRVPSQLAASADVVLVRCYTPTTPASVVGAGVLLTGAGSASPRLILQTRGSGAYVTRWTSQVIPWDTWVRVEMDADPGTSPTTGAARLRWYLGDPTVPQGDSSWVTGIDTAGTQAGYGDVRHGTVAGVVVDHIGVRDGADALSDDPWPSNAPPTLTLPAAQTVTAGQPWTLTALAADDGAIASYAWTVERLDGTGTVPVATGLSGQGTPTLSGDGSTTVAGSVLLVSCTVTDDGGLTATATTEVRVPTLDVTSVLATDGTGDPGWSVVGDRATTGLALADGDRSTLARSPDMETGTVSARTWRLAPMTPRTTLRLTAADLAVTEAMGPATVDLVRAGTVLATTTITPTGTDALVDVPDAMSTIGPAPADWSALSVRITARGT